MSRESACHFEHSVPQAQVYREQAHSLLERLDLPPTPACYAVAYDYVARRTEALRKDLDRELMRDRRPDMHLVHELFERFFLSEIDSDMENSLADIQRVLVRMLEGMAGASDGVCEYGEVLENKLRELGTTTSMEGVREITQTLARATRKAIKDNQHLRDNLQQAQRESEQLRRELVQVKEEASTDGLTSLLNRKAFNAGFAHEIARATAEGKPLSLVMLDIDHFKRINDNYGHPVGDEVIRRVAAAVRRHVRGTDVAGRYGGEEFTVLLPETDLFGALTVAGTIHRAIGKLAMVLKSTQQRLPGVTVSVGVASLRAGDDVESLLTRTDQALYFAKRSGRNRVVSERQLDMVEKVKPA